MKKAIGLALATSLTALSFSASTANAKGSQGITVPECESASEELSEVLGLDFCSVQARDLYEKHSKGVSPNFAKDFVLLHFTVPTEMENPDGTYWHNYVAVNTKTKKAYPFPFTVRDDSLSKAVKVKANRTSNDLCMPGSYSIDGTAFTGAYGGSSSLGELCFEFFTQVEGGGEPVFSVEPKTD